MWTPNGRAVHNDLKKNVFCSDSFGMTVGPVADILEPIKSTFFQRRFGIKKAKKEENDLQKPSEVF